MMINTPYFLESSCNRILLPIKGFLQRPTSGGIVLIIATIFALTLSTWLGEQAIYRFWNQSLEILASQGFSLKLSWHYWVNDGLMFFFFLFVGLELKYEVLVGELSSFKNALLPVIAALGGMIVPACIYAGFNTGTLAISGWGIPVATDIAFAVGILTLLGDRIPKNLILFLTALAIADDLGAVVVIALFYTDTINTQALLSAGLLFLLLLFFNRSGIKSLIPYLLVGSVLWYAMLLSGVHATLAGVLLAMTIPIYGSRDIKDFEQKTEDFSKTKNRNGLSHLEFNQSISEIIDTGIIAQSPLKRMANSLNLWVAFGIVPIFALANAGIDLSQITWSDLFSEKVTLGVMFGLAIGKFIGISLSSWITVHLGWGRLPSGVAWQHFFGMSWLGGIGFTMSLFISQLSFTDINHIEQAKLGIFLASFLSAIIGLGWLYQVSRKS
ncbi:Na+/H+ antiporter NhaA [Candidatus Nitrosacidococcus sp. I8]|uniref:Na+/H+ antiporter NhaA n=1 Tax=Candidatus Nitrosacidococcus sp. I8 TaxID=2942908 RepID=UPI0022262D93|nr:Na+/H+ antiporter NhaA [Candidatus Nitrosacidococcus sp. I8]CAH9018376.1 Na(+)/H(+) antiporter NhaA [Candidatus Nitrosacidococcus sp. I8]